MKPQTQAQLWLHFIILIWGFTGILGKLIAIPSAEITLWRMCSAVLGLLLFFAFYNFRLLKISAPVCAQYMATGVVVALHWTFFFEALHVSNVSLTLSCLASSSLFTALLEPLFFKRKLSPMELVFGGIVILGIYLIFSFQQFSPWGVVYALLSAFFASLFTVLNGKFIKTGRSRVISFYEMLGGFLVMFLWIIWQQKGLQFAMPSAIDTVYILILGWVCTAFAFVVSVEVMKSLSPFTVSISINLEPIYSIILALFIFGDSEYMSTGFYIGAGLILLTVFLNAWHKSRTYSALARNSAV